MTPSVALDLVPPAFQWMPPYVSTLGPEVADLAELAGFTPDPEQRLALDWLFAIGASGRAAVRDFGVAAPRQNLKTGFLKQAALGWLFITEQRLVVWSAHEFGTAQEAFRDMCQLIEDCPDLDREVLAIHRGNGDEAIELTGDRRLKFKARTVSGGRGLSGDKIVLDEAMYLKASHIGALVPTLRARPDPQVVLAGSGGLLVSDVWRSYRDAGRPGGDPALAWLEWCDPSDPHDRGCAVRDCSHVYGIEGCALDDRARWWGCNTALGRRITEDTLQSDRSRFPAEEFARETLGWWDDPIVGGAILDPALWLGLNVGNRHPLAPVLSVEVALDRSRTTLGSAWRIDGKPHVEVFEEASGVDWAVPRLAEFGAKYGVRTVVVDASTEAASLIPALEAARLTVVSVKTSERSAACAGFYDLASTKGLSHNGDPALTAALAAARWKDVGEGARVFSRRRSAGDIAALYAVTLALHGLAPTSRRTGSFRSF